MNKVEKDSKNFYISHKATGIDSKLTKALILGVTGQDGTYLSEFLSQKKL